MRFKLLGTEFYISFLFAAVITAMIAFDRTGYILPLLFAVLMHEGGHLAAMWILDCAPKRVRLVPASVEITAKMTVSHKNEIAVALCGPLVNIILFITFGLNYLVYKRSLSLICCLINLLIAAFNLLPVRLKNDFIGSAKVLAARVRPKFIGGARAHYNEDLM